MTKIPDPNVILVTGGRSVIGAELVSRPERSTSGLIHRHPGYHILWDRRSARRPSGTARDLVGGALRAATSRITG